MCCSLGAKLSEVPNIIFHLLFWFKIFFIDPWEDMKKLKYVIAVIALRLPSFIMKTGMLPIQTTANSPVDPWMSTQASSTRSLTQRTLLSPSSFQDILPSQRKHLYIHSLHWVKYSNNHYVYQIAIISSCWTGWLSWHDPWCESSSFRTCFWVNRQAE